MRKDKGKGRPPSHFQLISWPLQLPLISPPIPLTHTTIETTTMTAFKDIPALAVAALTFLGAFSRFTHGRYTPAT